MSRSYKKTPWAGDKKGKWKKRNANHRVRSWLKNNPEAEIQNNDYKKLYETWYICDFGWIYSWEEYWERELKYYYEYINNIRGRSSAYKNFPNKKEEYREWLKWYKNK